MQKFQMNTNFNLFDINYNFKKPHVRLSVCLGFFAHSRIFHSYGDVTITIEWPQILTYARHSAIEQLGFFSVPHLL